MDPKREREIYKVTLVGSAANLLLVVFKFLAGVLGHSAAMIADAVHSVSDFVTDIVVLIFVRISAKNPDSTHDYGHGKYESLACLLIGLALLAAAIGIIVSGVEKFTLWRSGGEIPMPGKIALWAALVSILVKELVYRYTVRKGRDLDSPAVVANAWHHRSDALSSIGAAIGLGGALLLGERWIVLDPLASIVVGAMLVKVSWELVYSSIGDLTDKSLPKETEDEIEAVIHSFPDVSEAHNLRTRRIGNRIAIEVHARMDGSLSLDEVHDRASEIEDKLHERFGEEAIVTIHMEPKKK